MTDNKTPTVAPYGSWESPITAERIAGGTMRLAQPMLTDDGSVYWLEGRPWEAGRVVLMRWRDGECEEALPASVNIRSRAHEYGGGAYTVGPGGDIFYVDDSDRCIHRMSPAETPRRLTEAGARAFADLTPDPSHMRLLAVCERYPEDGEPVATLVAIGLDGDEPRMLAEGADFFSSPRPSPDGKHLAWLEWDHPDMPWDATRLMCADLTADGGLDNVRQVAGSGDESIFQPKWSPAGELFFTSDRDGWWNLYRLDTRGEAVPVTRGRREYGLPHWVFGMSVYGFIDASTLVAASVENGLWQTSCIDIPSGEQRRLDLPFDSIDHLAAATGGAVLIAGSATLPPAVVKVEPRTATSTVLRSSAPDTPGSEWLSPARPIRFATEDGEFAHAFYYAPRNPNFTAPPGEWPPLIVKCHGGPTGATNTALDLRVQYWTSRGFAVLDVNYRGSTGFGRAYRRALYGKWGIADVEDCLHGARHLVEQGLADPERLAISGGSAGGFTVLSALTFHDLFSAGASHYGIGELASAMTDTHKFESRYGERLLGPWPDARDIYIARSPIHHADGLNCPVIFFQGLDDKVVPPDQAERMVAAMRAKHLPVAHVTFPGEGHGFRQGANIRIALDGELAFYAAVFGFTPAGTLPDIGIENLPQP